jgi:hypothetical protein
VTDQAPGAEPADRRQATTDFGLVELDLSLKGEPRSAPNPLRAADPERLENARRAVRGIVAARHAGTNLAGR